MNIKRIRIFISIIVILILVSGFFTAFYGSPWGKLIARKEISQYLRDKYPNEMRIVNVYYNFERGGYSANVYSDKLGIQFTVESISGDKYWDSYLSSIWQKEIAEDIKRKVNITDNTEIDVLMSKHFTESKNQQSIPYYAEALDKIKDLRILIINDVDQEINYTLPIEVISVLKSKRINYNSIYLSYFKNTKEQKIVRITREEAEKTIYGVEDIRRLINAE